MAGKMRSRRGRMLAAGLCGMVAMATISACTTGNVLTLEPAVDVGTTTAAVAAYPQAQTVTPSDPYTTVAYPRVDDPTQPPESMAPEAIAPDSMAPDSMAPAPMAADEIECRNDLKRLGVAYTDVEPIHGGGQCGIDNPVKVTAIGSVAMKPAATLTCDMAASFARWTKKELVPSARLRYFSGVKAIHQGSSYSCRRIAGERTLSEHGKGNALDVMSIELNNGDNIDVRKPGLFSFRQRGFLNTVRADGCEYFTTVLGPGYNYDHRNHFHFDIKNRKNGYRACR